MEHPMDFVMALSKNAAATAKFESLTEYERQAVTDWANACDSPAEMQQLIHDLATN